jgi:hypothetical protein
MLQAPRRFEAAVTPSSVAEAPAHSAVQQWPSSWRLLLVQNATSHADRPRLPVRPGDAALWRRRSDGRSPPLATNS